MAVCVCVRCECENDSVFQTIQISDILCATHEGTNRVWSPRHPGRLGDQTKSDVDSLPTLTFTGAKCVFIGSEFVVVCCKFYAQEKCFETRKKNKMLYFQTFAFFFLVSFANIWTYSQLREWLVVDFAIGPAIDGLVFIFGLFGWFRY